jgi:hypothetical protein
MATRKRKAKARKRSQASKRTRKIVKAVGSAAVKGAGRAVKRGATAVVERITREEVVCQASRDHWKNDFPNPTKPALRMSKVEREEYLARFDGELVVEFWIGSDSNIAVRDAAYEAAEMAHGPIAQSWTLTDIEPMNETARAVLPKGATW